MMFKSEADCKLYKASEKVYWKNAQDDNAPTSGTKNDVRQLFHLDAGEIWASRKLKLNN